MARGVRQRTGLTFVGVGLAFGFAGCGGGTVRRFPLREALWQDTDLRSVALPCRADPTPKDPAHVSCTPEPYVSPLAWDAADNTIFRPLTRVFAVDPGGEARNVNALDEVPDSSWFENRIGRRPMTAAEVAVGPCAEDLDPEGDPPGSWVIDEGKPNGATPGFRVRTTKGGKYMLKADSAEQPERPSAASAIGVRIYYAAGFHVPCDSVVYFHPRLLKLTPGLKSKDNVSAEKPFDQAALDAVLAVNHKRGDLVRMQSSKWLPGRTLGPFKYDGVRSDDPNDVIPHEDRRDLRAARLLAAWTNHFDAREQNSMAVWLADDPKRPDSSPGRVKHYYLDVSDCFGSEWAWDQISRRLGFSYYLDFQHVSEDFISLGTLSRRWDHVERSKVGDIFGYYNAADFEPEGWRDGYPNPTFSRMTERDGAWMARILARFDRKHIEAAVKAGKLSNPLHEAFLMDVVEGRHLRILRRYLGRLSPVTDVTARGRDVCGVDLGKRSFAFLDKKFVYSTHLYTGENAFPRGSLPVVAKDDGTVCVRVPPLASDKGVAEGGLADGAPGRYVVLDLENGQAPGLLRIHLYDLGAGRGLVLAGLERPEDTRPPP